MPSAKVIPLAARVPTPWTEEQPGHNPDQQQPGQPRPDITATRHPDRQHPKLVAGVDVAWDPLPEIRFRPLLWHAHAEGRGGQADGGQTNRHAKLCGVLMWIRYSWAQPMAHSTSPSLPYSMHHPFPFALRLSLWYVWLAMWTLLAAPWESKGGKGKSRNIAKFNIWVMMRVPTLACKM